MSSFNNKTIRLLVVGAALLGGGIYYEGVASKRVEQAQQPCAAIIFTHNLAIMMRILSRI